jgi:hypothetical protein
MAGIKGNVAWWAAARQTGRIANPITATVTTAVTSSASVVLNSVANIYVGQTVSGTGITGTPTVSSITSSTNTVVLSASQTSIAANAVLTFTTTAPTSALAKVPFTGGGLQVTRETGNLQETDSSRDQGLTYLVRSGVEGGVEAYVRGSYIHQLLATALGTDTVSGSGGNFTHTITPASGLPYYTFWRAQGDVLFESFTDCMVSDLTIKGDAGAPLTAAATIMGITPTRSVSETSATSGIYPTTDAVYNFNDLSGTGANISLGGTASTSTGQVTGGTSTHLVRSFEVQISNSLAMQQTDSTVPYDLVAAQRTVNLSFDIVLEDLTQYNNFFYGSAAGTSVGTSIFTTPMVITLAKDTNNSIAMHFPSVAYEAFPVQPNPNGDPIVVSVRAQAQRFYSSTGAALVMTAVVKNSASAAA